MPKFMMKLFDLTGEVAVVIGATGVLGGALAEGLAEAGAKVAVLGRNEERGNTRVKAIKDKGGAAAFFATDAVQKDTLKKAHLGIEKILGAPNGRCPRPSRWVWKFFTPT